MSALVPRPFLRRVTVSSASKRGWRDAASQLEPVKILWSLGMAQWEKPFYLTPSSSDPGRSEIVRDVVPVFYTIAFIQTNLVQEPNFPTRVMLIDSLRVCS